MLFLFVVLYLTVPLICGSKGNPLLYFSGLYIDAVTLAIVSLAGPNPSPIIKIMFFGPLVVALLPSLAE